MLRDHRERRRGHDDPPAQARRETLEHHGDELGNVLAALAKRRQP